MNKACNLAIIYNEELVDLELSHSIFLCLVAAIYSSFSGNSCSYRGKSGGGDTVFSPK